MRVVSARVRPFSLPFRQPVATARGLISVKEGWLLGLTDDAGRIGWGEAAPLPGWSQYSATEVEEGLAQVAAEPDAAVASALPAEVRAAADLARHDLDAQAGAVPLWRRLGAAGSQVPVNALISGRAHEIGAAAIQAAGAGFEVVKLKVGMADDLDRIRAAAWTTEGRLPLRLDANRQWGPAEADALAGIVVDEEIAIDYLEDPVADLATLERVRRDLPLPIGVDELLGDGSELDRIIGGGLADVVVLKPSRLGGLTPSRDLARTATAAGLGVVISSTYDTSIGLHGWAALAAAFPGRAHGLGTGSLLSRDVAPAVPLRSGQLVLGDEPGLGVEPRPEV